MFSALASLPSSSGNMPIASRAPQLIMEDPDSGKKLWKKPRYLPEKDSKKSFRPNSEDSLFFRVFFPLRWTLDHFLPTLYRSFYRKIDKNTVEKLPGHMNFSKTFSRYKTISANLKNRGVKQWVIGGILLTFSWQILLASFFAVIAGVCDIGAYAILKMFLRTLEPVQVITVEDAEIYKRVLPADLHPEPSSANLWLPWIYICVLLMMRIVDIMASARAWKGAFEMARSYNMLTRAIVYRKLTRLSRQSQIEFPIRKVIKVVHIMGSVKSFFSVLPAFFELSVLTVGSLIWTTVDKWNPYIPLMFLCIVVSVPVILIFNFLQVRADIQIINLHNESLGVVANTVNSIRLIKLNGWWQYFSKKYESFRNRVRKVNYRRMFYKSVISTLVHLIPSVLTTSILALLYTTSMPITMDYFLIIGVFESMRGKVFGFPKLLNKTQKMIVFSKLFQEYMDMEEVIPVEREEMKNDTLVFRNATLKWRTEQQNDVEFSLRNVNLRIRKGDFVMICGTKGKSSFLSAVLGEMPLVSGSVVLSIDADTAYIGQDNQLFSGTIEDNITFGYPLDKHLFETVCGDACLIRDLNMMKYGQYTNIGEFGQTVSVGQAQKIAIARMLYVSHHGGEEQLILLDDPTSNIDSVSGKKIITETFRRKLEGKTVLMASNQLNMLPIVDYVVYLEHGEIKHHGRSNEIVLDTKSGLFEMFLKYTESDDVQLETQTQKQHDTAGGIIKAKKKAKVKKKEKRWRTGFFSYPVCIAMFREIGLLLLIVSFFLFFVYQGLSTANYIYLEYWIDDLNLHDEFYSGFNSSYCCEISSNFSNSSSFDFNISSKIFENCSYVHGNYSLNFSTQEEGFWCGNSLIDIFWTDFSNGSIMTPADSSISEDALFFVYVGIVVLIGFALFLREIIFENIVMYGTFKMVKKSYEKVMSAPLDFFESVVPVGGVLDAFNKKVISSDVKIPARVHGMLNVIFSGLGLFVVLIWVSDFYFLIIFVPMSIVYVVFFMFFYQSHPIKYSSTGMIYENLWETGRSLQTIRSFQVTGDFINKFDTLNVDHATRRYPYKYGFGWFKVKNNWISLMIIMGICLYGIIGFYSGRDIVIELSALLALSFSMVKYLDKMFSTINSVDGKLYNDTGALLRIAAKVKDTERLKCKVPENWPSEGEIIYRHFSLSYGGGQPPALYDINLTIRGGERIGVCGNNSSGKSTLVMSLFRIVPHEMGAIFVDGIEISTLSESDLRSELSVVSETSGLFSGTIRENLDPFRVHSDEEIWKCLEKAKVKEVVQECGGLECELNDSSLTRLERKLLCISREILRDKKIVVFDEVASRFIKKDCKIIREIIEKEFRDCTVIIVTHHLEFIAHCDRIIALNDGRVIEFDAPHTLISDDKYSYFEHLVNSLGRKRSQRLKKLIRFGEETIRSEEKEVSSIIERLEGKTFRLLPLVDAIQRGKFDLDKFDRMSRDKVFHGGDQHWDMPFIIRSTIAASSHVGKSNSTMGMFVGIGILASGLDSIDYNDVVVSIEEHNNSKKFQVVFENQQSLLKISEDEIEIAYGTEILLTVDMEDIDGVASSDGETRIGSKKFRIEYEVEEENLQLVFYMKNEDVEIFQRELMKFLNV